MTVPREHADPAETVLRVHQRWLREIFDLTRNSVGFSAPVSARAYAYFSIGMYEGSVELFPELESLSGKLNGYIRTNRITEDQRINWPLVANTVDFEMASYLYRTMPPRNAILVGDLSDSITKVFRSGNKKVDLFSIEYGKLIAKQIIDWSKEDGGDEGFNKNYPENFEPPACPSCWTRTAPGYFTSLQPYWGKNKTLLKNTEMVVAEIPEPVFSSDPGSQMYKDAAEIISIYKDRAKIYEVIAEYWDDAPGYTGTPTGHFFSLATQLVETKELRPVDAIEMYLKLGLAINEAFIQCWKLKFTFNLIRPITYIHRYIDPQFNSFIATPSFPEYPSGHSFQSGAGSEILKHFFGDSLSFTDYTNEWRTDIDGTPRSYRSFDDLAREISISRLYGGIHFRTTLEISLDYGRRIGISVLNDLECRRN